MRTSHPHHRRTMDRERFMKNTWTICIDQNSGEYIGWAEITAEKCIIINDFSLKADDVIITFDEKIFDLKQVN